MTALALAWTLRFNDIIIKTSSNLLAVLQWRHLLSQRVSSPFAMVIPFPFKLPLLLSIFSTIFSTLFNARSTLSMRGPLFSFSGPPFSMPGPPFQCQVHSSHFQFHPFQCQVHPFQCQDHPFITNSPHFYCEFSLSSTSSTYFSFFQTFPMKYSIINDQINNLMNPGSPLILLLCPRDLVTQGLL